MPITLEQITAITYPIILDSMRRSFNDSAFLGLLENNGNIERGEQFEIPLQYEVNPIDKDLETTKVEFD